MKIHSTRVVIIVAVICNSKHKNTPSLSLPLFKHQSPLMFPLMTSTVIISSIAGMLIRSLYYDTDKYEILILAVAAVGLFSATKLGEKILIKRYGK